MTPSNHSDAALDGWLDRNVKSNLFNLFMLCLLRPIKAAVANAPPFAGDITTCYGCGASFAQAEANGRQLVRLACNKSHIFCKQCILEYWRQAARKNIATDEDVPGWVTEDDAGTPWGCICPRCGGYQGDDGEGKAQALPLMRLYPGEKYWNMRALDLGSRIGQEMQEYFQVPQDYLVRRQNTKYEFDNESFQVAPIRGSPL